MVLSGFEWFRVVSNGYEWIPLKTTQNHLKQHVSSGCEWFCVVLVVLSGFGFLVVSSGFEW